MVCHYLYFKDVLICHAFHFILFHAILVQLPFQSYIKEYELLCIGVMQGEIIFELREININIMAWYLFILHFYVSRQSFNRKPRLSGSDRGLPVHGGLLFLRICTDMQQMGIHDLDLVGTNCKFSGSCGFASKFCSLESKSPVPYGLLSKSSWQVTVKGIWGGKGLIT